MALKDANYAAAFLSLSKQRLYECVRLGLIPCVRIGRQVRFDEDALKEWVKHGGCSLVNDNGYKVEQRQPSTTGNKRD